MQSDFERYDQRMRLTEYCMWLFFAVIILLCLGYCSYARAEPGDTYSVLGGPTPQKRAASHSQPPQGVPVAGARPFYDCPARRYCGCWLAHYLHIPDPNKTLWQARAWLRIGREAWGPGPGRIAVYARGKGGHVGIITQVTGPNTIIMLSGNDGGAVRERERSTVGIIGFRQL